MARQILDVTGKQFGRLVAVQALDEKLSRYKCLCNCGGENYVAKKHLISGVIRSCGCFRRESGRKVLTKHGLKQDQFYKLWSHIKSKTTSPDNNQYYLYGGRGIKMHPKWECNPESFIKYIRMALGPKPTSKHSLDRIDNEKGYVPGNLRWATATQQNNNRRPRSEWRVA